jgi:hypothetical protein
MVPPGFNLVVHVWLESPLELLMTEAKGRARCNAFVGQETVMTGDFGFVIIDREKYNRLVGIEEKKLSRACRS